MPVQGGWAASVPVPREFNVGGFASKHHDIAFSDLDPSVTIRPWTRPNSRNDERLAGRVSADRRHQPVLTFDVALWINDRETNRRRCERALESLEAEWGESDSDWGKVAQRGSGWLDRQPVFYLTSPSGAIDIFRSVTGLPDWAASRGRASRDRTASGTPYWGLSDEDMLRCQLALEPPYQKSQRIATLERVLREKNRDGNA